MRPYIEALGKCTTAFVLCYPNAGVYLEGAVWGNPNTQTWVDGVADLDKRVCFVDLGVQLTLSGNFLNGKYLGLDHYFPLD